MNKLKQGIPSSRIMNVEGVITASLMSPNQDKYIFKRRYWVLETLLRKGRDEQNNVGKNDGRSNRTA
jgi:hypothetical protein